MSRLSRLVYLIAAWLFVAGVLTQVFLAGMLVTCGQRISLNTGGQR